MDDASLRTQLVAARDLANHGLLTQAEAAFSQILLARPDSEQAAISLARMALARGDGARADAVLSAALAINPGHEMLAADLAIARAATGRLDEAIKVLRDLVERNPAAAFAWLLLGQMLDDAGRRDASLMARFEAISRAQLAGHWINPQMTPQHLIRPVSQALADVRGHRREIFFGVIESLRHQHGSKALSRVDRALTGYLGDWDATPPDPMQRPRFFYFPDLPALPYLDPFLQPWAPRLQAAFADIRAEALTQILGQQALDHFVQLQEGDHIENYLGGLNPSWEAFFFYRHGKRYDDNHARCPKTSAVLESLDLIRIPGQTPEICFSVLRPGTHILPHHGVTNTRTVMHLPLLVPADCALHLVDRGVHRWKEGELVMFDDTYLHEAWNRSNGVRVIVLMDCWNPLLSPVEREAVTRIAQTIGALDVAMGSDGWPLA